MMGFRYKKYQLMLRLLVRVNAGVTGCNDNFNLKYNKIYSMQEANFKRHQTRTNWNSISK